MFQGIPSLMVAQLGAAPAAAAPTIGTQTDTDTFTHADQNPITTNWTTGGHGDFAIISNAAGVPTLSQDAEATWTAWSHGDDHYSQGEITATGTSAGAGIGVYARHAATESTKTGYRLVMDGAGNVELAKFVAGVYTQLATRSVTYVAGTKLGLSATGGATTTLKIWYGGAQQGADITDSSSPITTGVPGIGYSSTVTTASLDNWDGGTTP